jgi:uncharacterized membrane protein
MRTARLEAFSDGVIAILITIMVLDLHVPLNADWHRFDLAEMLSYALSFVFLGIYWNNHHHLLHLVDHPTGGILWANLHLLFWLSLVPYATKWVAIEHRAAAPTAIYGIVLLLCGAAFTILQRTIIASQGTQSKLRAAIGSDAKGKISLALYAAAIAIAFSQVRISQGIFVLVAFIWLVPDRRIERHL